MKGTHHLTIVGAVAQLLGVVTVLCSLEGAAFAGTINAATCSRADVGNAVAAATYDDIVVVPAGTCTWATTLTITKGITLQGAGIGSTVINSGVGSGNYVVVYNPDSTSISTDRAFRITGFTWDMKNLSSGMHITNNSTTLAIKKSTDRP